MVDHKLKEGEANLIAELAKIKLVQKIFEDYKDPTKEGESISLVDFKKLLEKSFGTKEEFDQLTKAPVAEGSGAPVPQAEDICGKVFLNYFKDAPKDAEGKAQSAAVSNMTPLN